MDRPDGSETRLRGHSIAALIGLLGVVAAGAAGAWGLGWLDFSFAELEAMLAAYGHWAPILVVALMVVHCFVPFPAEVLALCAGAVFGTLYGTALIWLGAMLGASLSFGLARWLGREAVARLLPARQAAALDRWAAEQGALALLISRFIPVIAFNLINYAAGLTRVSWWTFLWTTAVGILPLTIVMVWLGAQMRSLSWPLLIGVSAVAILAVWGASRFRASSPGGGSRNE